MKSAKIILNLRAKFSATTNNYQHKIKKNLRRFAFQTSNFHKKNPRKTSSKKQKKSVISLIFTSFTGYFFLSL